MKTKHIFSLLLAFVLCAFLFAGCGTPAETTADTTAMQTEPDETAVPESTKTDVEVILSAPDGTRLTLNSFLSQLGVTVPDDIVWTADFDEKETVTRFVGRFTEKTDKSYRFHTYKLESISDMTSLLHQSPDKVASMFGKTAIAFPIDGVENHKELLTAIAEANGIHGSFFATLKEATDKDAESPAYRTFHFLYETPYEHIKGDVEILTADTDEGLIANVKEGKVQNFKTTVKNYGKLYFSKDKLERYEDVTVNP